MGTEESLKKEIYKDALQPVVRVVGTVTARAVEVALAPVRALVWGGEQIEKYVHEAVGKRLKDVPPERIRTPEPTVAGPALEALRFAGNEEMLRELYANLLATAMDRETAERAHPAFVEVIKQLTPDEARILKYMVRNRGPVPVISIFAKVKNGIAKSEVRRRLSLIGVEAGCQFPQLTPNYLENFCRLALTEIPFGSSYIEPRLYQALENHPEVAHYKSQIEAADRIPQIERQCLDVTNFGAQFLNACVVQAE